MAREYTKTRLISTCSSYWRYPNTWLPPEIWLSSAWTCLFTRPAHGVSVPNSQMALYVLPLIASIVEERYPALAERIRALLPCLTAANAAQWHGRWYNRAVLLDILRQPVIVGQDRI